MAGQGSCLAPGSCQCEPGYTGVSCAQRLKSKAIAYFHKTDHTIINAQLFAPTVRLPIAFASHLNSVHASTVMRGLSAQSRLHPAPPGRLQVVYESTQAKRSLISFCAVVAVCISAGVVIIVLVLCLWMCKSNGFDDH